MRLDRYLARFHRTSRKQADRLVRGGRVTVDGAVVRTPARHLDPEQQRVEVEGEPVDYLPGLTLALHKPSGVVTATRDGHARTVLDLVPERWRLEGLAPVGRLDKDATGLLVLTTDGALNHRLTHPRRHAPRVYRVVVEGEAAALDEATLARRFADGLELGDGTRCRPAGFAWLEPGVARVRLHEGRHHQVKRMIAAVGGRVAALHREAVGGLELPADLAPGTCRPLAPEERTRLEGGPPDDG